MFARNINRDVGSGRLQRIEEKSRLDAAAAAKFDQVDILANGVGHLRGIGSQDREFYSREIVFIKLADLIKERGALFIIKVFAWKFFSMTEQSIKHIAEESLTLLVDCERFPNCGAWSSHESFASRIPVNCHRASGGKKFR
jgi:hypothetical protein